MIGRVAKDYRSFLSNWSELRARFKILVLTKDETVKTLVWQVFIYKKTFWPRATASQQSDQIFVVDTTNNINFVVEICSSVFVVVVKPLDCNLSTILQNSLQYLYFMKLKLLWYRWFLAISLWPRGLNKFNLWKKKKLA